VQKITPFLWFDTQAEEAVRFYTSVFRNSRIGSLVRYTEASANAAGRPAGSVMSATFEIEGQRFMALNGGPLFRFTEAISFVINCESQEEVDYYWEKLSEGGDEKAQQCGWLKDRFGLSWQIVPAALATMLGEGDPAKSQRVMQAVLRMKKIDIAELEKAYRTT
jgi:predicted 3-demethylubiquinone-9 3-methyltransferase (glyoxalase superfamily)